MFSFSQQLTPAVRAHMDAQYALFKDMSQRIFDTARKINELNIQVANTVLEETLSSTQQFISARDPLEAVSIATTQAQPAAEKLRAYQQHLTNIAAGTQVDLARTAETHVPNTSRTAAAMADEVARRTAEESERIRQRQKAAMEKATAPPERPAEGKGQSARSAA